MTRPFAFVRPRGCIGMPRLRILRIPAPFTGSAFQDRAVGHRKPSSSLSNGLPHEKQGQGHGTSYLDRPAHRSDRLPPRGSPSIRQHPAVRRSRCDRRYPARNLAQVFRSRPGIHGARTVFRLSAAGRGLGILHRGVFEAARRLGVCARGRVFRDGIRRTPDDSRTHRAGHRRRLADPLPAGHGFCGHRLAFGLHTTAGSAAAAVMDRRRHRLDRLPTVRGRRMGMGCGE
ncbi:hypothetical protein MCA1007 [Methylococcus capsulatus str. Bath]|uniref:Uncharacterized protein n=1 Tax=Methylococcus capsulatus (strain ATCC 33009 / NCIMB 11132 / Bath) TaxID=243233 RepID=Q60A63_METCA|nr:hypothetical protein MCA1007 [Methylococcus capsulatus str. Bath]